MQRIREDGLRVLRGFRFMVTKGLTAAPETDAALRSELAVEMLSCVSLERVREELEKMFAFDTLASLRLLGSFSHEMQAAIFRGKLRLSATMKK